MSSPEYRAAISTIANDAVVITRTHEVLVDAARGQGPGGLFTSVGEYHLDNLDRVWVARLQDWQGTEPTPDLGLVFRTDHELVTPTCWQAEQTEIKLYASGLFRRKYREAPTVHKAIVEVDDAGNVTKRESITSLVSQRGLDQLRSSRKIRRQSQALAQQLGALNLEEIFKYSWLLQQCTPDKQVVRDDYTW